MSELFASDNREFLAWELGQQIGENAMKLTDIDIDLSDNIILGEE